MQSDVNPELGILAQAVQFIQETATAETRDAILNLADGRVFLYSDKDQQYAEIERFVKMEGSVSTVESFADLVIEYAGRVELPDGSNQTVTFTGAGATYSPNDDDRRHLFTYKRVLSQQWQALVNVLKKPMTHKDLIRALQSLSPSIQDYALILSSFRRLTVSKDVRLVSEPVLNETGDSANGYNVQLSVKGGTSETTLPSALTVRVQYARGSSASYPVPVEVDLSEREGVPVITLFAPLIDAIADQAVMEELALFKTRTDAKGMSKLLSVVNF